MYLKGRKCENVETSSSSISLYLNSTGDNLYYGGPTEYYQLVGTEYVHTITNERHQKNECKDLFSAVFLSISNEVNKIKNVFLLYYIINNRKETYHTTQFNIASTTGGLPYAQQQWFRNLDPLGYFTIPNDAPNKEVGGCGFIGLNMIYGWFDKFKSVRLLLYK